MTKVLITGGTGYIGSHTCIEFLNNGDDVVLVDNFKNSSPKTLNHIKNITKKNNVSIIEADIRNELLLTKILNKEHFDAVIHLAGLKSIPESIENPDIYYQNNVEGTISLLNAMENSTTRKIIFSSSAAVYGTPRELPIKETHPLSGNNPYAKTKIYIENLLQEKCSASKKWQAAILRYFNAVGAHPSGLIGENLKDLNHNLIPCIAKVALEKQKQLNICGTNYPTDDGTGVRDYIHVMDLAKGHLKAFNSLKKKKHFIINLGTGSGYSVLDVLKAFELASEIKIPYVSNNPRLGDVAISYADCSYAEKILDWKADKDLTEICKDAWNWYKNIL